MIDRGSTRLAFDRHQRYALAARLITPLRCTDRPLRVLEIGAHDPALEYFLPAGRLTSLNVHEENAAACSGSFVRGDATASPFLAGSVDVVVALDVLEHVAPARRDLFLAEAVRVARRAVVLAAPFHDPEVVAAEIRLNAYFRDLHGVDFPWLAEHRRQGLPVLEETVHALQAAGTSVLAQGHGNVALWTRLMRSHLFVNSAPELTDLHAEVDELYNRELFERDWQPPFYRHFIVACPAVEDLDAVRESLGATGCITHADMARLQERLEVVYERGERLRSRRNRERLEAETGRAASAVARAEARLQEQEAATATAERTLRARDEALAWMVQRADELGRQLERVETVHARMTRTKSWRLTAPLRRLEPSVRTLGHLVRWRLHRMRLEPGHDLVLDGDAFRSTGPDPMLLLHSSRGRLPVGWAEIACDISCEDRWLDPKLYFDRGRGFSEEDTAKLPLRAQGRIESIVHLPHQLVALRLDPLAAEARFSVRNVTIREIGSSQVAAIFWWRHLRTLGARPSNVLRLVQRGLSVLRTGGFRALRQRLLALEEERSDYQQWVLSYDTLTDLDRALIRQHVGRLGRTPTISVVMATHDTPERWLRLAIDSVRHQLYPHWELCIADDASTAPHVRRVLEEYAAADSRIKVTFRAKQGHISVATNSALELASSPWVAFLDHDDELAEHALYMAAVELAAHPDAALVYSDEDKIDERGQRYGPYFKPDWNPELILAQNMVTHLCVCRTELVRELGGLRPGFEGAQDWDLVLRLTDRIPPSRIRHVPHILYHWRAISGSAALAPNEKRYARNAQRRALHSHFERLGERVELRPAGGIYWHVKRALPEDPPLVSIIIPTRDRADLLRRCLSSIFARTTYPRFEVIVVDNQTTEPRALRYLDRLPSEHDARVLRYDAPFNYSAINNFAVGQAQGTVLALVNNDVEVITPGWLDEMVSNVVRPDVGAVGAMLYYPNDSIQHAGVILGLGGIAGHAHMYRPRGYAGHAARGLLRQDLSAVTGACLVVRRDVYDAVGGLDEANLPIAYNDVDLCLRIRERGWRVLWTPHAELYHHESASRGYENGPTERARSRREADYLRRCWNGLLKNDPAYNPNLALDRASFALTFPPRAVKPWIAEREAGAWPRRVRGRATG